MRSKVPCMFKLSPIAVFAFVFFVFASVVFALELNHYQQVRNYWGGEYQGENSWLRPDNVHVVKAYQTNIFAGFLQDLGVDADGNLTSLVLTNSNGDQITVAIPSQKSADANIFSTNKGGSLDDGFSFANFYNLLDIGNYFSVFITHEIGSELSFLTGVFINEM